jgi:hypothetical protein
VSSTMPKSSCGVFQEAGVKTRWQQVTPTTCRGWMDGIKDLPLPVALGQSLGRRESNFSSSSSSTCVRARCEMLVGSPRAGIGLRSLVIQFNKTAR